MVNVVLVIFIWAGLLWMGIIWTDNQTQIRHLENQNAVAISQLSAMIETSKSSREDRKKFQDETAQKLQQLYDLYARLVPKAK